MTQIKYIIVHHTGGTDAQPLADSSNYTVQQCDKDHRDRFNMKSSLGWYVGYTYYIAKDGTITQTRKDGEIGAHTVGYNVNSIGICLAGNFDATLPTEAQIASLKKLLSEKSKKFNVPLSNIVPHRAFAKKTCYGTRLSEDWARNLIKEPVAPQKPVPTIVEIGQVGEAVKIAQDILKKNQCEIVTLAPAIYDENMAKCVLYFQIKNSVASTEEISKLRGERIGAKTVSALLKVA